MKGALQTLGEYETPAYGMTPYPDTPMFEGMKRVQKKNGLTVDGIARPGGPTETTVKSGLAKKEVEDRTERRNAAPSGTDSLLEDWDSDATTKRIQQRQKQWAEPAQTPKKKAPAPQPQPQSQSQPLALGTGVGQNQPNRAQDVVALKNALSWTGHYPADKAHKADPSVDEDLTWGLSGFQRTSASNATASPDPAAKPRPA